MDAPAQRTGAGRPRASTSTAARNWGVITTVRAAAPGAASRTASAPLSIPISVAQEAGNNHDHALRLPIAVDRRDRIADRAAAAGGRDRERARSNRFHRKIVRIGRLRGGARSKQKREEKGDGQSATVSRRRRFFYRGAGLRFGITQRLLRDRPVYVRFENRRNSAVSRGKSMLSVQSNVT